MLSLLLEKGRGTAELNHQFRYMVDPVWAHLFSRTWWYDLPFRHYGIDVHFIRCSTLCVNDFTIRTTFFVLHCCQKVIIESYGNGRNMKRNGHQDEHADCSGLLNYTGYSSRRPSGLLEMVDG